MLQEVEELVWPGWGGLGMSVRGMLQRDLHREVENDDVPLEQLTDDITKLAPSISSGGTVETSLSWENQHVSTAIPGDFELKKVEKDPGDGKSTVPRNPEYQGLSGAAGGCVAFLNRRFPHSRASCTSTSSWTVTWQVRDRRSVKVRVVLSATRRHL
ncbi:hypothetical protein P175DRAFT_0557740 [Aspergillus ochraceoroseus IBT 24754]|uniref:Uncharacterized protein n=1 Tax=Aspergillus ochraceoroseus IBT 24754 TaxID=1392256 RepID=A0A2T5LXT9_9EURO|nr:uncharacterized protein P175DRAFT_0557740 [Aspergillus ochraceoroseus IBT 24754]PTU21063.1 hypothetical protein P175DRAFT_0557740 [Aspergillus ochraceoroseus IBT 24754]